MLNINITSHQTMMHTSIPLPLTSPPPFPLIKCHQTPLVAAYIQLTLSHMQLTPIRPPTHPLLPSHMWLAPNNPPMHLADTMSHAANTNTTQLPLPHVADIITHANDTNMATHISSNTKYRHLSMDLMWTSANKANHMMQACTSGNFDP